MYYQYQSIVLIKRQFWITLLVVHLCVHFKVILTGLGGQLLTWSFKDNTLLLISQQLLGLIFPNLASRLS